MDMLLVVQYEMSRIIRSDPEASKKVKMSNRTKAQLS